MNTVDPLLKAAHAALATSAAVNAILKSRGEGSRGGHIIRHTKSGKPIYAASHPHNQAVLTAGHSMHADKFEDWVHGHFPGWSKQDHLDAADAHKEQSDAFMRDYLLAHRGSTPEARADGMQRLSGYAPYHSPDSNNLQAVHLVASDTAPNDAGDTSGDPIAKSAISIPQGRALRRETPHGAYTIRHHTDGQFHVSYAPKPGVNAGKPVPGRPASLPSSDGPHYLGAHPTARIAHIQAGFHEHGGSTAMNPFKA